MLRVLDPPRADSARVEANGRPGVEEAAARVRQGRRASGNRADLARLYALYAGAFLGVTVLSGLWLRAVFVWPALLWDLSFGNLLHAHSHVAFFGWTTMALYAAIVRRVDSGSHSSFRAHAHITGAASVAAFAGFALMGYAGPTIALSVLHVILWGLFAHRFWSPLASLSTIERSFVRAALTMLVLAGVAALMPGMVMAFAVADPWVRQITVQAFLTLFVTGWLLLGVLGALYSRLAQRRYSRAALWLIVVGAAPSALAHTTVVPPIEWLGWLGKLGTVLVGLGVLAFAVDVVRSRAVSPLVWVVAGAALVKGTAELVYGTGLGPELLANRSLTIAYLHLTLLGLVTPALLLTGLAIMPSRRLVCAYATGLILMLAALVTLGWPAALVALASAGIRAGELFALALVGGGINACAALWMVVRAATR